MLHSLRRTVRLRPCDSRIAPPAAVQQPDDGGAHRYLDKHMKRALLRGEAQVLDLHQDTLHDVQAGAMQAAANPSREKVSPSLPPACRQPAACMPPHTCAPMRRVAARCIPGVEHGSRLRAGGADHEQHCQEKAPDWVLGVPGASHGAGAGGAAGAGHAHQATDVGQVWLVAHTAWTGWRTALWHTFLHTCGERVDPSKPPHAGTRTRHHPHKEAAHLPVHQTEHIVVHVERARAGGNKLEHLGELQRGAAIDLAARTTR